MNDRAQRTLERFEQRRPDAFRLAMLASLAVRVDAHLLRRLRTTLTPDADVGVEADLWFSPLVESRGVHGFVLAADSAALLRELLATQPALLERAGAVTADAHRDAPATIRLEEKVNTLALMAGDDNLARIDEALRPAVLTMVRDARRGLDIARWAARALPRFHPRVHETESAVLLAIGAAARLGFPLDRPDAVSSATTPSDHRWVLPSAVREQSVTVGVELLADGVRFVEAGQGSALTLPRTSPLLVHLLWRDGDAERRRTIEVRTGKTERLGATVDAIRFRTLAGDEFLLAADPVRTGVDAALVEIETLGSVGPTSAGFIVAPDRIVTAAEPFRGIPILAVKHGSRSFQARVIHPAEGIQAIRLEGEGSAYLQDIMVLAPIDMPPLAPVLPLEWRLSRTDPRQSNVMAVESRADVRWIEEGTVAHVGGDIGVLHDGPTTLTLATESSDDPSTPPPRLGAPLVVRGKAVGLVTRVEGATLVSSRVGPGRPFRIHAVGATVIEKVLQALLSTTDDARAKVVSVTVSPAAVNIGPRTAQTFTADVRAADGTLLSDRHIEWRSSDSEVFRIVQTGPGAAGTSRRVGIAEVTAECEGVSGFSTVAVTVPETQDHRLTRVPLIDLRTDAQEPPLHLLVRGPRQDPEMRRSTLHIAESTEAPGLVADALIHVVNDNPMWPRAFDLEEVGTLIIVIGPEQEDGTELSRALHALGVGVEPGQIPAVVVSSSTTGLFLIDNIIVHSPGTELLVAGADDRMVPDKLRAALARLVHWEYQPGGTQEEFERLRALLTRVERGVYPPVMPLPDFVKEAGDIRAAHAARIAGARVLESGGDTGVAVLDEKLFERIVLEIMDTRRMKDGFKGPLPVIPLEEMRRIVHGVLDGYGVSSDLYYALFDGVVGELRRIGVLGVGRGVDGDWLVYPAAFEPAGPTGQAPLQAEPVLIASSATPALREMLLVALDIVASERYDMRASYWRTPPRCGVELAERASGAPLYLEHEPGDDVYRIVLRAAYGTDRDTTAALADSVDNLLRSLSHTWITIERPDAGEPAAASKQAPL